MKSKDYALRNSVYNKIMNYLSKVKVDSCSGISYAIRENAVTTKAVLVDAVNDGVIKMVSNSKRVYYMR